MASGRILQIGIGGEQDVVMVRQRARQISALLGFSLQDQVRIATAVSEVARSACRQQHGGRAIFSLADAPAGTGHRLDVVIRGAGTLRPGSGPGPGPWMAQMPAAGDSADAAGLLDAAAITAQRLMDHCVIETLPGEVLAVTMSKLLPARERIDTARLSALGAELAASPVQNTFLEMQQQNQELAITLAELRERQDDLMALTRELEDTNRGVVALYAEIEEKAERLRKADEMKSRFLSNTSHELRTPLSSIRALAKLLLDRMDGDLSAEQERQVGFIASAANDLSELVNDLLDLAKIEAGKVEMTIAPVNITNLFSALKGMLRPLAQHALVELVFEPPEIDPGLVADEGKLAQILRNFISNALKFTEAGQVTVTLANRDAGTLRFAVSDTGIGISPDNLQLIFEEFSQIEHPLQRRAKGTGLGLPLCRKLATLMGGEVDVDSTPGMGSTFYLTLPRHYNGATEEG